MIYGYHRTSTTEQHLDRGMKEISDFCEKEGLKLERIFTDQQTGKNFLRPRYQVLKEDVLRQGDILIVTEIDRLGRDKSETMREISYYKEMGIRLMVLELPTTLMDFSKMNNQMATMMLECINSMMLELYAAMAQAEIEKKEKRQREGIAAKKARGDWDNYGRPKVQKPKNWSEVISQLDSGESTAVKAMELTCLKKTTFYKLLKEDKAKSIATVSE